ncbi:TIGR04222 domain-containing membrane protein [Amycolatopsis eburnea]|uniref:TIGR04222 domain-containing membrane protein n=1 Tax=Amycolatopsis eburnea TaxID=2267691 RepID=A0A3R9EIW4_9PSEU|nr:TIGR04222 domain-containing membrane protein [Amycolatopsis eburnea]RSD08592.1 TIGR04222 domain-containing membrane protein [Amycolatopsis eburnea]
MTDTWGIPGPVFAGLYLALLLLTALVAVVRLALLARGHAGGAPKRAEELALLTGGRLRAGEVVVARLLDQQVVRLDGSGRVSRVKGSAIDALGRAALQKVGKHGSSVDRVRAAVAEHPELRELETALAGRGLLADPRKARTTRVAAAVALWLLVVLGVVRLIAGASTGHPVGYLLGLLVLGLVLAIFATVKTRNEPQVKATSAGRKAAADARRAGTLTAGPAGAVAAGGFAGHPDKDIRLAVSRATQKSPARPYRASRTRWASAGGGAAVGYYGGSSCGGGGGSSCGGGGGGCGGGGGGGCGG